LEASLDAAAGLFGEIAKRVLNKAITLITRCGNSELLATPHAVLADFGEFLGCFADRTILLVKTHPLLGSGSLVSCLLFNFRGQASRCVKQTTPTRRQLDLFATSYCYYVMLVKSEVFQASHITVDAAFKSSIPSVSLRSKKCLQSSKSRGKKRARPN
jgi:hypothetical protein